MVDSDLENFEIFLSHSSLDYEKVRKIRKAFACYLKARNIASFNDDPDLSGFYFEAREDPIHEALVGHVPIRDLIWPDNIVV